MTTSKQCLDMFKRNTSEFMQHNVSVDKMCHRHYTREMKVRSAQWVFHGESAPKKVRTSPSARKVMATHFWDSQGIMFIDYLADAILN